MAVTGWDIQLTNSPTTEPLALQRHARGAQAGCCLYKTVLSLSGAVAMTP